MRPTHQIAETDRRRLGTLAAAARAELERLAIFWLALADKTNGGHFSFVDNDGHIDRKRPRSTIFVARILWTLSAIDGVAGSPESRAQAESAYRFLTRRLIDRWFGGFYWAVSPRGGGFRGTDKHTCAQAYGVYALAAFARMSGNREALATALATFRLLERRALTPTGYTEAFSRLWRPIENRRMKVSGIVGARTVNTHIHILEAYTELYLASGDPTIGVALSRLLRLIVDRFPTPAGDRLWPIFDDEMTPLGGPVSYGHDIESSWLIAAAADALGDTELAADAYRAADRLCRGSLSGRLPDGSFAQEGDANGIVDTNRIWWVQAEALSGMIDAFGRSGDLTMLDAAEALWRYIVAHQLDREGGEWFERVSLNGEPVPGPRVTVWKEPYHQARACLKVIECADRLGAATPHA